MNMALNRISIIKQIFTNSVYTFEFDPELGTCVIPHVTVEITAFLNIYLFEQETQDVPVRLLTISMTKRGV